MTAPKWPTLAWIVTTAVLPIAALPHVEAQPSPQQSPPAEAAQSDDQAARQERLVFMTRVFDKFELFTSEHSSRPLASTEKPVLRYSNPVRNFFSDGATFLWLDGNRPLAAGTISVRGSGEVWREFTSFSGHPLRCIHEERPVWTPQSGNLVHKPVTNAPKPASSPRLRMIQMRQLARRYTVNMQESQANPDKVQTLRLLQNPLYEWSDGKAGRVKGAVFSFCETTDPEALLLLEIDDPDGEPIWTYSFARMTSHPLILSIDDREVLYLKGYWANPRARDDSYDAARLSMYEPGEKAPDDS